MRYLFSFVAGYGHFFPLVPVAKALKSAGHTVVFGCSVGMKGVVEEAGFEALIYARGQKKWKPPSKVPLRPLDQDREDRKFKDKFAYRGPLERVPMMKGVFADWRPDVIVCDETDFAAMLAAEALNIPHVVVLIMAAGVFVDPQKIHDALDKVRAEFGLPSDPEVVMLRRHLVLSPFPPSFRHPDFPLPKNTISYRGENVDERSPNPFPGMAGEDGTRPNIYFSLGTVFNLESGDLFSRVLNALQTVDANVLVTVGPYLDPAELGSQPERFRIEQFMPQAEILPYCNLVISHGGSGSISGILAHGIPAVLIPMGADQEQNARRAVELGLAQVFDPVTVTSEQISQAVLDVLADSSYRLAGANFRAESDALPDAAVTVSYLERLGKSGE